MTVTPDDLLDRLRTRRLKWRLAGYGLVGLASFFAGLVPLLQAVVQVIALVVLHVVVLRRGLLWLGITRRIFARLNMKLFGASLSAAAVLINVAIAPFVGFSAVVLAMTGPLLAALYVEGSLLILRRGLRREADGRSLQPTEWLAPVGFVAALLVMLVATAGLIAGALHLIASIELPGIAPVTEAILEFVE